MFAGGVDTSATETKGTVLIHTAEQVYLKENHFFFTIHFLFNILGYDYVMLARGYIF